MKRKCSEASLRGVHNRMSHQMEAERRDDGLDGKRQERTSNETKSGSPKPVASAIGAALVMMVVNVQAQQVPMPTTAAEVSGPVAGTFDDQRICSDGRTHGLLLGLSDRRHQQPSRRVRQGTRAHPTSAGFYPWPPLATTRCCATTSVRNKPSSCAPTRMWSTAEGLLRWRRSRWCSRCRTSANVSGSIRSTTTAPMKSAGSVSNTALSPAST